jgi:hypothetical protein
MPANAPAVIIPNYPNYTADNPDPNLWPNGTGMDDFDVEFGYPVTNDAVGCSPIMLLNGWTNALKMTVNKITGYQGSLSGSSAGVNLYPTGMNFSGNYALRFSECVCEGTVSTTELGGFYGINAYGTNCNWASEQLVVGEGTYLTNSDGIFYWMNEDAGIGSGYEWLVATNTLLPNSGWYDQQNISGQTPAFDAAFKNSLTTGIASSPYTCYPDGTPANNGGAAANSWADVEIKQVNNVVTLSVNKFPVATFTNTSPYKSGNFWLGYDDPYASIGSVATANTSPGAETMYSNVRVVQLTPPTINASGIGLTGTNLTIPFTDSDTDDTAASFYLLGSSAVSGPYAKVTAAFSQNNATGGWKAVVGVPTNTVHEFYAVVRVN